jgi:hypothetical protein
MYIQQSSQMMNRIKGDNFLAELLNLEREEWSCQEIKWNSSRAPKRIERKTARRYELSRLLVLAGGNDVSIRFDRRQGRSLEVAWFNREIAWGETVRL